MNRTQEQRLSRTRAKRQAAFNRRKLEIEQSILELNELMAEQMGVMAQGFALSNVSQEVLH